MKVGQIINILPSQSNYIWKCLTIRNQTMGTKKFGKAFNEGFFVFCKYIIEKYNLSEPKVVHEIFFQIIVS